MEFSNFENNKFLPLNIHNSVEFVFLRFRNIKLVALIIYKISLCPKAEEINYSKIYKMSYRID